jgi:hypothetical protein
MKLVLNVGQTWPEVEHVYSVGYRGQAIGRVWFAADRRTDPRPWEWHLAMPLTLPDDSKGLARSLDDALQAVGNALHRLIRQTPHDRLERAFQFGAAAGLQFDEGDDVILNIEEAAPSPAAPNQPAKVMIQGAAAAGAVQRTAQAHAAVAAQTPPVTQTNLPKKRMPVVRVQAARAPPQVIVSQKAAATAVASAPPASPASK